MNRSQSICFRIGRLRLGGKTRRGRSTSSRNSCRMARTQSQTDECSAIRGQLRLPTMIGLVLPHRDLGLRVPLSAGCAAQILLVNQCGLNFCCAAGVNRPLTVDPANFFPLALFRGGHPGMTGCGCTVSSAAERWSNRQSAKQQQRLACSKRGHAYLE